MTITVDIPAEWEMQLRSLAKLQGKDPATFLRDQVQQKLRPDILTEPETALLARINMPAPSDARKECDRLRQIQTERPLTDAEHNALADAVDTIELANADRWHAIAALADQRGLSLAEITRDLEISLP